MPPKRKGRKLAIPLIVPPKKRKAVREIIPEPNEPEKLIPEWLKVSIQILLINFHSEGVALLNSIQSEYEAVYKDTKIEPNKYDFPDWETMLKSPQCKSHFFVYTEKKIPRVKGYPLPRSANISINNFKWTIDPGIEYEMEPERSENDPGTNTIQSDLLNCPVESSSTSLKNCDVDDQLEPVVIIKPVQIPHTFQFKKFKNFFNTRTSSETLLKTLKSEAEKSDQLKKSELQSPVETTVIKNPDKNDVLNTNNENLIPHTSKNNFSSNLPQKKRAFEHWNLTKTASTLDTVPIPKILDPSQPQPVSIAPTAAIITSVVTSTTTSPSNSLKNNDYDSAAFFRRTDVPQTWTRVDNDNTTNVIDLSDDEYSNESEEYNDDHRNNISIADEDELIIDENPVKISNSEKILDTTTVDSAKSPDADRFPLYNPFHHVMPPILIPIHSDKDLKLNPEIIPLSNRSNAKVEIDTAGVHHLYINANPNIMQDFSKNSKNGSSLLREFNDPEVKGFENVDLKFGSFKANSTTDNNNSSNTAKFCKDNTASNTSSNYDEKNTTLSVDSSVVTLTDWKFIPVLLEKPVDFCDVNTIAKLFEGNIVRAKSAHKETKVDFINDPRLISGFRSNCLKTIGTPENAIGSLKLKKSCTDSITVRNTITRENVSTTALLDEPVQVYDPLLIEKDSIPMDDDDGNENCTEKSIKMESPPPPEPIILQPLSLFSHITETQKRRDKSTTTSLKRSNAIPQDNLDLKTLRFTDLWKDTKWKRRFVSDGVPSDKFYNSSIYSRWKEVWKNYDISKYRKDLIHELQKYEERPYPSRCEYFLRSSLRMVEIDYLTDNQFSDPKDLEGEKLLKPDDILYYVDFAGAPGGVIEFYNMNRKWSSKGFGVTYQKRSYNVYALPDVIPECFEAFYGKLNTMSGDGSLFCAETVHIFVTRIMEATQGKGVHVVTTIGNVARVVFEDDNDEKWRYQHLAQIMVALRVLREGGNMAFKMYDIKSTFATGLLYLLYRSFDHVEIAKLNIFAPSSGERAIICLSRRKTQDIHEIQRYLQECHKIMADWYLKKESGNLGKMTIEELIPFSKLESCEEFFDYLRDSNERLKRAQLEEFQIALRNLKIHGSIFSKGLYRAFVAKTTALWKTGERPKRSLRNPRNPLEAFKDVRLQPEDACEAVETILNEYNLYTIFSSPKQWRFLPVGQQSKTRGFYMGVDGIPHFLNMKHKQWVPVRDQEFRLPCRTLVYAEIVHVFSDDGKLGDQIFSIIDAAMLGGNDIRDLNYSQRIKECEKFSSIVTRIFFPRMTRITCTKAIAFSELSSVLMKVEKSTTSSCSSSSSQLKLSMDKPVSSLSSQNQHETFILPVESVFSGGLAITGGKQRWFTPSGILFIETDNATNVIDFCSSLISRVHWEWVPDMDLPITKPINPDFPIDSNDTVVGIGKSCPIGSVSAMKMTTFISDSIN